MAASRKVRCKLFGFAGVVEAHDTQHFSTDKIFRLLGKDTEGYIHLKCPVCSGDSAYSPFYFMQNILKMVLILLVGLIAYFVFRG